MFLKNVFDEIHSKVTVFAELTLWVFCNNIIWVVNPPVPSIGFLFFLMKAEKERLKVPIL